MNPKEAREIAVGLATIASLLALCGSCLVGASAHRDTQVMWAVVQAALTLAGLLVIGQIATALAQATPEAPAKPIVPDGVPADMDPPIFRGGGQEAGTRLWPDSPRTAQIDADAQKVLMQLGYKAKEAQMALRRARERVPDDAPLEDVVKEALQ